MSEMKASLDVSLPQLATSILCSCHHNLNANVGMRAHFLHMFACVLIFCACLHGCSFLRMFAGVLIFPRMFACVLIFCACLHVCSFSVHALHVCLFSAHVCMCAHFLRILT